jgi:hypothetical protein
MTVVRRVSLIVGDRISRNKLFPSRETSKPLVHCRQLNRLTIVHIVCKTSLANVEICYRHKVSVLMYMPLDLSEWTSEWFGPATRLIEEVVVANIRVQFEWCVRVDRNHPFSR